MKLEYTFTNDALFKMVFVNDTGLLRDLVAELLRIPAGSIAGLTVANPEIPPEAVGDKFCRLDLSMTVDGQIIDLEIQVKDEHDYPQRSLFYWAREYSTSLGAGGDYAALPRTIVISIVNFVMFSCRAFHSEFAVLEVTRQELLCEQLGLHFYELPKLPALPLRPGPAQADADERLLLWLALFKADTEDELAVIEGSGVAVMEQAVRAYRRVAASPELREIERLREKARHDEAQALHTAEARAEARGVVRVLERRGIAVNDTARKRIESCTNLSTLETWFDRAFDVSTAEDLFTD